MKTDLGTKKVDHLRNQLEPGIVREFIDTIDCGFNATPAITGFQNDPLVVASFEAHARAQREREIDGRSARVKKIKRPDINSAAGQVDARWGRGFDNHEIQFLERRA